jgi:hypothetical protein
MLGAAVCHDDRTFCDVSSTERTGDAIDGVSDKGVHSCARALEAAWLEGDCCPFFGQCNWRRNSASSRCAATEEIKSQAMQRPLNIGNIILGASLRIKDTRAGARRRLYGLSKAAKSHRPTLVADDRTRSD